ncbi:MAG TPA: DUF6789 family protein [Desulfosporosinus sp.]
MFKYWMRLTNSIQKIGKMQDSITTGLLGGFIGAVFMSLSHVLMYKAKKTEVKSFGQIAGQLFVSPWRTKQRKNFILGELLHLVVGSLSGIPLFLVLKKTGKDHYLSKGLAASMLTWGALFNGGQKIGLFKKLRFTKTHYTSAWSHIIYGLTASQAIVSIADPTIFATANEIDLGAYHQVRPQAKYSNLNESTDEVGEQQPRTIVH